MTAIAWTAPAPVIDQQVHRWILGIREPWLTSTMRLSIGEWLTCALFASAVLWAEELRNSSLAMGQPDLGSADGQGAMSQLWIVMVADIVIYGIGSLLATVFGRHWPLRSPGHSTD